MKCLRCHGTGEDPGKAGVQGPVSQAILDALDQAPRLGAVPKLRTAGFWTTEERANPGVDYATQILKAEAWLNVHPPKKDFAKFMHNWLGSAERMNGHVPAVAKKAPPPPTPIERYVETALSPEEEAEIAEARRRTRAQLAGGAAQLVNGLVQGMTVPTGKPVRPPAEGSEDDW